MSRFGNTFIRGFAIAVLVFAAGGLEVRSFALEAVAAVDERGDAPPGPLEARGNELVRFVENDGAEPSSAKVFVLSAGERKVIELSSDGSDPVHPETDRAIAVALDRSVAPAKKGEAVSAVRREDGVVEFVARA